MLLLALLSCVTQPEDDGCLSSIEAWADEDGDGYGGASVGAVCELRAGLADNPSDCDDADPDIHPGAEERCNGLDDDCIDGPDQGLPGARILYTDADGDGVGAPYSAEFRCGKARADQVEEGGDCDDDDPLVSPAAVEVCNGFDDDCDYLVDDDDGSLDLTTRTDWFRDADSDGYGGESPHRQACRAPAGFVDNSDDCDEVDPFVHPGAVEVVGDGLDQDCDTHDTCYQDRDRDGYGGPNVIVSRGDRCTRPDEATEGGDCDDTDPAITIPRDWYGDADGDGYGFGLPVGYGCTPPSPNDVPRQGDCDPTDPAINPGAEEVCDDAIDHDCDGAPDCCPVLTATLNATYPVTFGFDYCWGAPACPYTPPAASTWDLAEDGTWSNRKYTGTWWVEEASCELVVRYDSGTEYTGSAYAPGCLTGDMVSFSGGPGTWSGCAQ
ncbi:MAG: putative metal-binding motif-containing protein [Alphaproteobacteria bacterium]|nr:putative metal-binding motif-containing protein [Alphaproteobacteria bacterium]